MAGGPSLPFDALLTRHRKKAGLTQEDLAEAAGLSARSVSDLERGLTRRPRRETIRLLANALNLTGPARLEFEAAGRGRASADTARMALTVAPTAAHASLAADPRVWLAFIVGTLDEHGADAARSALALWHSDANAEPAWLAWADRLITLTAGGKIHPASQRPVSAPGDPAFPGRAREAAELAAFARRSRHGRGGLALVMGPAGIGKSRLIVEVVRDLADEFRIEWLTLDRGEAGYRGWRRLLAPLWSAIRRAELAPAGLLTHAPVLDEILLTGGDGELAGAPFPGLIADAIAALLNHLAAKQAVIVVIDDAQRGGASSDRLLLDVARRVNADRVGIIAGLRPDELEPESPLAEYSAEAAGRSLADIVVPVHVPPLDPAATTSLLDERTGVPPPPWVVEQVLRQTGGRPQLIHNIDVQAASGREAADAWTVGRLGAAGLRVLESTLASRTGRQRTVLRAAAVCATGGQIPVGLTASTAGLPAEFVEQVLDRERRHGSILLPLVSGYRFEHDNWLDALVGSCPPAVLHKLHARCLAALRSDPAADPRRLAPHAIGAGAALIGAEEVVRLARQAGDLALSDSAFSTAAELFDEAARHACGDERIDLMIRQSDALRLQGLWEEARSVLRHAVTAARTSGTPGREAAAVILLERLTWSYGMAERDVTEQLRSVLDRLPPGERALRAGAHAALAMRLSITHRQYEDEQVDHARAALEHLDAVTDPAARTYTLLGIRSGLQDSMPPERLLKFDRQAVELALKVRTANEIEGALAGLILDLLRAGQTRDSSAAVRTLRELAENCNSPVLSYSHALIQAMLALARGDFTAAADHTSDAARLSARWGESMAGEALTAQAGWLLYETGQVAELTQMLPGLRQQSVSSLNEPVWALAAGIIYAEADEAEQAVQALRAVCASTLDLRDLPRGPGRIGILAAAATVLGHPAVSTALAAREAARIGGSLADLLADHHDTLVMAGWPSVLLGSKRRYIGLAHLAAGRPADAAEHLAHAASEECEFPVLQARTRFDLARALLSQPNRRVEGIAEMKRAQRMAFDLGMARLAARAAAELTSQGRC